MWHLRKKRLKKKQLGKSLCWVIIKVKGRELRVRDSLGVHFPSERPGLAELWGAGGGRERGEEGEEGWARSGLHLGGGGQRNSECVVNVCCL